MTAHKKTSSLILTLGLALVAMPLAIAGNTDKKSHEAMFKKMDSNGDGKVTRVEHTASAKLMFASMDTNKDGKVSAAEMTAAHGKMKVDTAAIEVDSARTGTAATPAKAGASAKTDTVVVASATPKPMMSSEEIIKKGDTNNDGQLSADEHLAAANATFTKADTNKDDALTLEECTAGGMMKH
ncbi:MAG TPA: EF-hand domain-containing protein [Opitutaceae bacterium]|nr:EF-hand domain-containing protein [Opitutaceae bacterium]